MKFGIRKPSISKKIKARTTGKAKKAVKNAVNPLYGKSGMGFVNDPGKAVYNKVYNKTSIGADKAVGVVLNTGGKQQSAGNYASSAYDSHQNDAKAITEYYGQYSSAIMKNDYASAEKYLTLAENASTNIIDLHYCYNSWIELTYKQRENPHYLNLCIEYCKKDIDMFPAFKKAYAQENPALLKDGILLIRLPSFQQLAIIYEKQGEFQQAIEICEMAISYGLSDSTKGGFEGRLEKLRKKQMKQ